MDLGNLENLQESYVRRSIDEILSGGHEALMDGFCICHGCMIDVFALALNSLPPKYVADKYYKFPVGTEGNDPAFERARRAVVFAIRKVKRRPHCERVDEDQTQSKSSST